MKEYSKEEIITLTRQVVSGKLAATITHKSKNVLMPITGYVELIERGSLSPAKLTDYLKKIEKAGQAIQSLLQKYLRFSRSLPQSAEEEIVLSEIIENILALFEHQLVVAKVTVEKNMSGGESVLANYDDLSLILASLLFNALEATPPRGKIRLSLEQEKDRAFISISDDGPGVSEEVRDKIFEPFFTTKKGSLGLGLTASLFLSQRLGADLSLNGKNEFILRL